MVTKLVVRRLKTRYKFCKDLSKTKLVIWECTSSMLKLILTTLNTKMSSRKTTATFSKTSTSDLTKTAMLNLGSTLKNLRDYKKRRKTKRTLKIVNLINLAKNLQQKRNCQLPKRKSSKRKPRKKPQKIALTAKSAECN